MVRKSVLYKQIRLPNAYPNVFLGDFRVPMRLNLQTISTHATERARAARNSAGLVTGYRGSQSTLNVDVFGNHVAGFGFTETALNRFKDIKPLGESFRLFPSSRKRKVKAIIGW
jgi:hypothetical protein